MPVIDFEIEPHIFKEECQYQAERVKEKEKEIYFFGINFFCDYFNDLDVIFDGYMQSNEHFTKYCINQFENENEKKLAKFIVDDDEFFINMHKKPYSYSKVQEITIEYEKIDTYYASETFKKRLAKVVKDIEEVAEWYIRDIQNVYLEELYCNLEAYVIPEFYQEN